MIKYATDKSKWEEWQHEYQYGAFYIFPPAGIIERVDGLRHTYDPKSASICQAHISLSEPLGSPLTDNQIQELKKVLGSIDSFEIQYGPLRSFPPYPGICYSIQPEDRFQKIRTVLHQTSVFTTVPLKRKNIAPHMTIAEFITVEQTGRLLEELSGKVPEGSFRCKEIEYAIPDKDFHFQRTLSISLKQ